MLPCHPVHVACARRSRASELTADDYTHVPGAWSHTAWSHCLVAPHIVAPHMPPARMRGPPGHAPGIMQADEVAHWRGHGTSTAIDAHQPGAAAAGHWLRRGLSTRTHRNCARPRRCRAWDTEEAPRRRQLSRVYRGGGAIFSPGYSRRIPPTLQHGEWTDPTESRDSETGPAIAQYSSGGRCYRGINPAQKQADR